ncbi:MAG: Inner rane component of tripartite multidrug resistance system, partial [Capsulimonas sp.]|nr:Inner rane component of tripartite multidrug resistance system [Capsulimonas sp.]
MATQTAAQEAPELLTEPGGVLIEDIPQTPNALPPASHQVAEALNPYRWFILAGLITAAILQVLDTTIVNVALPQMAGNLGATSEEIGWVVTGYILSNVIFLPMTAFLTQRFGRKRYLTASIVLFVVSSFFCGTSHTLGELVFWRILQGAGGAALLSTAQATLVQVFPKSEQGFVQSLFMMGLTVAPTLGPTLGGWITDNYTWNWCFLINVPIGIVAATLVVMFLHDSEAPSKAGSVDWLGIGLLATGLGAMQYLLEEGERNDWFQSSMIVTLAIVSVICISGLIYWQLSPRNRSPVVDFRVLKNPTLSACLFLFIVLGFGLYGGTYLFPLLAQTVLGFTSMQTGLALLPGGMATASAIVICGAILNRPKPLIDTRIVIVFGTLMTMLSMWMLGHISSQSGQADTALALLIRGLGAGFLFIPINQAAFASLQKHELQQASGLLSLSRQLGGSFGIAALATFVTKHIQMHRVDLLSNYNDANLIFTDRVHALAGGLMHHGLSASAAHSAALELLDKGLMRQAMTMSYADAFLTMLIVNMITLPAVFLLRKNKSAGAVHV